MGNKDQKRNQHNVDLFTVIRFGATVLNGRGGGGVEYMAGFLLYNIILLIQVDFHQRT